MTLPPEELLERLATTLRQDIGPAVTGAYPRTQAFMAAVVAEKLARQLAVAPAHERADAADLVQLYANLDARLRAEEVALCAVAGAGASLPVAPLERPARREHRV